MVLELFPDQLVLLLNRIAKGTLQLDEVYQHSLGVIHFLVLFFFRQIFFYTEDGSVIMFI